MDIRFIKHWSITNNLLYSFFVLYSLNTVKDFISVGRSDVAVLTVLFFVLVSYVFVKK